MNDQPHDFVLLEDDYLAAARELREIATEKRLLYQREADCKRILEKKLTVGERGISPDGDQLVYVRQGARVFKECIAAELLPAEQLSAILTLQPDAKLAREVLPEDMYDACCIYNNSNVVVV
jgi:transketolase C-terminal domain/subunit